MTQYVIGILSLIFGTFSVIVNATYDGLYFPKVGYAGPGLWTGICIVTTGYLGSHIARKPLSDYLFGIYLTFNIITAFSSFVAIGILSCLI